MPGRQPENAAPYTTEELAPVREALQRRRRELVDAQAAQARDIEDEQSRDPATEEEEAAAHQHAQFISTRMREGMHREVQAIDAALARMDVDNYGRCEECDEPIAIERLRVLPYTRLCAADATIEERDKVPRSSGRSLTL